MATDAERKLEKQSVQWKAATRAVKQGLTFEEVYERVHRNDVSSLDFDFAALSNDEKEHLIMGDAALDGDEGLRRAVRQLGRGRRRVRAVEAGAGVR